jgi:hypothetical protein
MVLRSLRPNSDRLAKRSRIEVAVPWVRQGPSEAASNFGGTFCAIREASRTL